KISATRVPPKTAVIDVEVTDESPARAQLIAQTVAQEFVSYTEALETPTGEDSQKVHTTVVTAATEPHEKRFERLLLAMLAGVTALLIGAVAVWIRARTDAVIRTAHQAAAAGVPVLYYITPQVWAWGAKRLTELARTVTKAAVILPFEETLLREHGIDATFVGHPLLDRALTLPDRVAARAALGVSPSERLLALFPGSRAQEIARHLDLFVATARELQRRDPALKVIVSAAPHVSIPAERCPYPLVHSASFAVLRAADAAMCKSGTTTLEAAVALCPLVVAYRTSALTYAAARRLVRIPYIGLVNVVAGREVAREFVQDALVPARVADELMPLLDAASPRRAQMIAELATVRAMLGEAGAATRVATMALELASRKNRARSGTVAV
ncbi:MAG: Lipid-A-disaccharide synthase, partial [Gemmatimonadetes bacterium]|nr:Lipid-A-disaccharide synthase [Gemmatimonadota bacterium]